MKFFFLAISIFTSLTITDYSGSWEYLTQAPDQDYKGTLEITKEADVYTATINSDGASIDCKDFRIEGDKMSFNIDLQGYRVNFNGTFSGDELEANVSVEGMEFPMKATRKKK